MDTTSVWRATAPQAAFDILQEETATDVVIVGGGITGVTLALNLAEQGIPAVLLEAHEVGCGSTGNSTGNLYETVSRGIRSVVERWDKDMAHAVALARRAGVDQIERRVRKYGIGCGFRRCPLYRYATAADATERIENEYRGSLDAGMAVHYEDALPAPFHPPHGRVMVLDNQAQFHPQAYVRELARQAAGHGCLIFEYSPVLEVDTSRRVVRTADGKITAKEIVLATHSPIGLHLVQAEMVVNREYGLATRIARDSFPAGIFWGSGVDRISARSLEVENETFLVCVGEEHKTGHEDANINLDRLEASAAAHFDVREIAFRWSAQNYSAADGLPYIGKDATDCFIATGFQTDGLTWGTVAASIIADEIIGRDNLFAPMVKASRFSPIKSAKGLMEENVSVMKSFIKDYVTDRPDTPLPELMPGSGAIVKIGGESLATYRAPDGALVTLSPVCTHMKCKVHWNNVEKSWDCPCHGSRFATDGRVIEGPATEPLKRHFLHNIE